MLKPLLALAALSAALSTSACCWPHGHHHGRGYSSDSSRARPEPAPGHGDRHVPIR